MPPTTASRAQDIVVDPLVMPIGAIGSAGRQVFRVLRRLHDELGVNTTCGASNVSFGLPSRNRLNGAFLSMAIANGLTLGDHEPAARRGPRGGPRGRRDDGQRPRLRRVDREPSRELRRPRRDAAGAAARRGSARRRCERAARRLRPLGPAGFIRGGDDGARRRALAGRGPRLGLRRTRDLRPMPGHGLRGRARRSTGSPRPPNTCSAFNDVEVDYRERQGLTEGRRLGCQAALLGDVVIDVPPDSQVHRQVVRKEADAHPIEVDPVVRLHYVEVAEPDLASPASDLRRLQDALELEWGLTGLQADLHVLAGLQSALRDGEWKVTVAVHDASIDHRGLARVPRPRARGRVRRGLHHGGRPPVRPRERRGARERRLDEPADPVRRGPDEPRELRDDESRCRGRAHAGRPRVPEPARRRAHRRGRRDARGRARGHDRRQPDHAPPRARASTRPSSGARRSRWPPTRRSGCGRPRSTCGSIAARGSTCCRASPGTSAPTPRA